MRRSSTTLSRARREASETLEQARRLGLRLAQALLGLAARGDVGVRAGHAQGASLGVARHDAAHREDPFPVPGAGSQAELAPVLGEPARHVVLEGRERPVAVLGVHALDPLLVGIAEGGGVVAQHAGVLLAHDGRARAQVDVERALVRGGERQAQPLLAQPQGLRRARPLHPGPQQEGEERGRQRKDPHHGDGDFRDDRGPAAPGQREQDDDHRGVDGEAERPELERGKRLGFARGAGAARGPRRARTPRSPPRR